MKISCYAPHIFHRVLAVLLSTFIILLPVGAQERNTEEVTEEEQQSIFDTSDTGSYTFLEALRRFEIIMFGTLPFTLLFVNVGYDIGRALYFGFSEGFSSPNAQNNQIQLFQDSSRSDDEKAGVLIASISVSVVIAVIDLIIELTK